MATTKKAPAVKPVQFKLGDRATWTSSSNGSAKTKKGVVDVVIPAGMELTYAQQKEVGSWAGPRDHESYLVRVPTKTKLGRGKLYWPIVSKLRRAA